MIEVATESRHVPIHMQRTALFLSAMRHFASALTRQKVGVRFVTLDDPKNTGAFAWPVTREQALAAIWASEPTLYHSTLSSSLNLKLLNPRECCERAIEAYRVRKAPLQSVEAFIRQIIGWREFIRGVYWMEGPQIRGSHRARPARRTATLLLDRRHRHELHEGLRRPSARNRFRPSHPAIDGHWQLCSHQRCSPACRQRLVLGDVCRWC